MKTLLASLFLFTSLPSLALDFDKLVREGDTVEFTQAVTFVNPSKYDEGRIRVRGREAGQRGSVPTYRYVCSLYARVAANSKATIQAGRKMKVTSSYSTIDLENGVTISCASWHTGDTDPALDEIAHIKEPAEIMRSLGMIRITRQPPPAPDDREL